MKTYVLLVFAALSVISIFSPSAFGSFCPIQRPERILLVDDNRTLLNVQQRILQDMGFAALTADSGRLGLAIFQSCSEVIDVVIVDRYLGDMIGTDVIEEMLIIKPNIPAILTSGTPIGCSDVIGKWTFLEKPFSPEEFEQRVRNALEISIRQKKAVLGRPRPTA